MFQSQKEQMRAYTQDINSKIRSIGEFMADMKESVERVKNEIQDDN